MKQIVDAGEASEEYGCVREAQSTKAHRITAGCHVAEVRCIRCVICKNGASSAGGQEELVTIEKAR